MSCNNPKKLRIEQIHSIPYKIIYANISRFIGTSFKVSTHKGRGKSLVVFYTRGLSNMIHSNMIEKTRHKIKVS